MKECNCCKEEKSLKEFYSDRSKNDGKTTQCKLCIKRKRNAERQDSIVKESRRLNAIEYRKRSEVRERVKKYNIDNRDKKRLIQQKYYYRNKGEIRSRFIERLRSDPLFSLENKIRASNNRIKRGSNKFNEFLGCTYKEARSYLDLNNHTSVGENVNIDHIIPLAWAKTEDELMQLSRIENLHIIRAEENRFKFNKIYPKYYTNEILNTYGYFIYRQLLKNYE